MEKEEEGREEKEENGRQKERRNRWRRNEKTKKKEWFQGVSTTDKFKGKTVCTKREREGRKEERKNK